MSPETLANALGIPLSRAKLWADPLSAAMALYDISTPARQAAFLAQVGHESGRLVYVKELWGPTDAQKRYEGRIDLGNTQTGDGFKYRGRGLIQVTGRANYSMAADALNEPLTDHPEVLEQPDIAALSAAWFWNSHGLNQLADTGQFETITRRINGGINGLADRLILWSSAKTAFGVA
jgi:putative chitinase